MTQNVRDLEPKEMWNHFADLNAIPRPSKKEDRIIEFMLQFGKKTGLETMRDEIGNVILKKPASKGMENKQTVVLQSHLDMVHQKNASTNFDFDTMGIEMYTEGDWVKAKGTTLGADNGIGVASIMAVLSSDNIAHPPIEALFTIDEETGMTGAINLKGGLLQGSILLNLDTEDDDEITIGCAGGVDVTATGTYDVEEVLKDLKGFEITVKGLTGGHSGMDIYKGRGNANKIMNRILLLATEKFDARICEIDGGGLRNAIPRESKSKIHIRPELENDFRKYISNTEKTLQFEYRTTDPNFCLEIREHSENDKVLEKEFQLQLLRCIYATENGIYRMSPDIEHLVQTSNNIARVLVKDGEYTIQCLTRSSVDSEKNDLATQLRCTFEMIGAKTEEKGAYPGWTPKPDAAIVKIMRNLYHSLFKEDPKVSACHAGLECGILGTNYPDMEMISFGPNIRGAHSPDEMVQISSVNKYWKLFLETLKNIPDK
ncbi:MAG: aminoacyl-histidine dipeptidase [Flavobacteriales bacterium]|nr:aminoacyl-histidine dipeptidase [Flavobacteriales bacterium]